MHNYKELLVWKKAIALATQIYQISGDFPDTEKFGLVSQMRRSVISISSNIAEGAGRRTDKEFAHFLGISHASVCELESQLHVCKELQLVDEEVFLSVANSLSEVQRILFSLIRKFDH